MRRRYMANIMSDLNNTFVSFVIFNSFTNVNLCRIVTPSEPSGSTGDITSLFKGYELVDYYQKDYGDNAPLMRTELVSEHSVLSFKYSNPGSFVYGDAIYLYKILLIDRSFFIIHSKATYATPYVYTFLRDRGLLNINYNSAPICFFEDGLIG